MGFFHEYPYTDFHEINLDWILRQIMKLHKDYDEFKALNTITFSGAWDITKQYPSWTIVNVGGTTGYISIQPVPEGIDYTNTDYWRLIADYTITMADLQNRVVALENAVDDINDDMEPLLDEYTLEHNMKILFVGDSYSGTSHWTYKTGDLFGLSAGVSYWVNAVGGEGFTIGQDNNGFLDELVQFHNNASVPDDEITHIIVGGGANDAMDPSVDIEQGIIDFMNYAATYFPNAKVYLGFIGAILNSGSEAGTRTQELLQKACFFYSTICKYGGNYLAGMEFVLHKNPGMLDAGGLHPTMAAGNELAKSFYNAVKGFNAVDEWIQQDVVAAAQLGSDTDKTFRRCNFGRTVSLSCTTNTIDINPGTSTLFESSPLGTHVYTLSNIYFNRLHIVSGLFAAATGSGVYPVDIVFNEDKMYIRSNKASGSSFDDITTTRLIVRNFTLTVPALDVM